MCKKIHDFQINIKSKVSSLNSTIEKNPKTILENMSYLQKISSISSLSSLIILITVPGGTGKTLYTEIPINQNIALNHAIGK